MDKDSGPKAGLEGVVEDVKGKVKEIIGRVTGRRDVEAEGETQQEKASSERDAAAHEAKAEAARARATKKEANSASAKSDRIERLGPMRSRDVELRPLGVGAAVSRLVAERGAAAAWQAAVGTRPPGLDESSG